MTAWKPELIALDLDGTLLNSDRQITPGTCAAIGQARACGVKVIPCSGRHFSGTRPVAMQAGMGDVIICGNGALVTTWQGETIFAKMLNPSRCLELLDLCEEYHLSSNLYADDVLYTLIPNSVTKYYEQLNEQLAADIHCSCRFVSDMRAAVEENAEKIMKFEIFPLPYLPPRILFDMLERCPDMSEEGNLRTGVELHASGVNKGTGLAEAARYLGIPMENVMAVGNGENDVTMLKMAGMGAAMGNAVSEAKAAADLVLPSNNEDGVAWAIHRFVHEKEG